MSAYIAQHDRGIGPKHYMTEQQAEAAARKLANETGWPVRVSVADRDGIHRTGYTIQPEEATA